MKVTFTFNRLPKTTNAKGKSQHWAARKREADYWKKLVWYDSRFLFTGSKTGLPAFPMSRAKLTLIRYSSVSPDFDGLVSSFKHVIDALIAAGILENDKFENIGAPTYEWRKAPPKKGHITVTVETLGG